jgi:hypothetical protein
LRRRASGDGVAAKGTQQQQFDPARRVISLPGDCRIQRNGIAGEDVQDGADPTVLDRWARNEGAHHYFLQHARATTEEWNVRDRWRMRSQVRKGFFYNCAS